MQGDVIDERKETSVLTKLKTNSFIKRLLQIRHIKVIVCVFILAVVLLIVGLTIDNKADEPAATTITTMTDSESRLAATLSKIEGAGAVSVMITYKANASSDVQGVIVVAEGAKNIGVRIKLTQAVITALNIKGDMVEVFAMN